MVILQICKNFKTIKMEKPLVSVIICTFNSGKITQKAIESVINNSYDNIECVVVDGASKDGTVEIIKSYDNNPKFKYISEPDTGIYNAMNKGWKMAKGEWIHYLGADDKLTYEGISQLFEQSNGFAADVVYGHILYRKANGNIVLHPHHSHEQLPWKIFACHQGILMKKSIIEKLGGFDEHLKIIADKDLIIRSYFLDPKCIYIPTDVNVAIFSGGGASSNLYKCFKEDIYIYKKVKPGIKYILYVLQHYPRMWLKNKLHLL